MAEDSTASDGPVGGVFISYRRTDEPGFAGRLYDKLAGRFGDERVFMDVDSIEIGLDFVDELTRTLQSCVAMIVIIGHRWIDAADSAGRRLDNQDDFVRMEIEAALSRNIRVIPVLVEGAAMPRSDQLPSTLQPLARRNGRAMYHARFGADSLELLATLQRVLDDDRSSTAARSTEGRATRPTATGVATRPLAPSSIDIPAVSDRDYPELLTKAVTRAWLSVFNEKPVVAGGAGALDGIFVSQSKSSRPLRLGLVAIAEEQTFDTRLGALVLVG